MGTWQGDAIIFDLDGVLIDADAVYERHWKRWAAEHNVALEDVLSVHHGRPAMRTIEVVAPEMDAAEAARRFNAGLAADRDLTGIVAFEGVAGLVGSLQANRWAIATSAPRGVAVVRLEYLGLPLPEVFVTIDDVASGKPAPDPYLLAAQRLGYEPERCLVIEDAPAGIEAAVTAGATVLGVATTHHAADLAGAHAIVDRLMDIEVVAQLEALHVEWTDAPG